MTVPRRGERLHKILARAGVASRRKSEDLIREGRVKVDGQVVSELGLLVDPEAHQITVDDEPVEVGGKKLYIMLHKPRGVLSTTEDRRGRLVVLDLVPASARLFPVGRLDLDSEGLVLLTNDGELANRLTHPRYGHWREYLVVVEGEPSPEGLHRLQRGVDLEDGPTAPARVHVLSEVSGEYAVLLGDLQPGQTVLSVKVREGRKRQVRRMMDAVGLKVVRLIRVGLGPLRLGSLPQGACRPLRPGELRSLMHAVGLSGLKRGRQGAGPGSRQRVPHG